MGERTYWSLRAGEHHAPDAAYSDPLDADAVRAFATGKLASYKIPRYVCVIDEFPMTVTGKVRKVELREQAMTALAASR